MKCPECQAEMEQGRMNLKGWGGGWPFYAAAELRFKSDLLIKDWCSPLKILDPNGTIVPASRCRGCRFILFEYPASKAK